MQYRPEIFYHDAAQKAAAEASKKEVEKKFGAVPVNITPLAKFYPAEDYHQDYYRKNPDDYHRYRTGCGRDRRLKELWGDEAGKAPHRNNRRVPPWKNASMIKSSSSKKKL